jgi:antitoxin PrlF
VAKFFLVLVVFSSCDRITEWVKIKLTPKIATMTEILQAESTLTDRYQTTVPDIVRKTLGLSKRDKIAYVIKSDGTVTITRSEVAEDDPILDRFLSFLVQDIEENPQHIQLVTSKTLARVQSLVRELDIDLDAPLSTFG